MRSATSSAATPSLTFIQPKVRSCPVTGTPGAVRTNTYSDVAFRSSPPEKRARNPVLVIHGLAIVDEEADLEEYFLQKMIVGLDAFAIVANSFDDFGNAMKKKLLREITPVNQAQLIEALRRTKDRNNWPI